MYNCWLGRVEKRSVASDPIPLLLSNGPIGVIVAAPVIPEGATEPVGFITFSYELASLMLTNDDLSLFSVALKDPRSLEKLYKEIEASQQEVDTLYARWAELEEKAG